MYALKSIIAASLFTVLTASAVVAQDQAASFNAQNANVHSRPGGQALTLPSQASAPSVVAGFLRSAGLSDESLGSLVLQSQNSATRTGLTHLRFEQQVDGLTVNGAYVKATVDSNGQLVHLIEALATPGALRPAVAGPRDALDAAMAESHPGVDTALRENGRSGNSVAYTGGDFFHRDPTVTRIAIAMNDGALQEGYRVETWSDAENLLHYTIVGANGRVLNVELRTNNDQYNIFPIHPNTTAQQLVDGPGPSNAESPVGWLYAGTHKSINIAGNNAHAYLDRDGSPGVPDSGGTPISDGFFVAVADLFQQPFNGPNQDVAVQNLFYFNNLIHDKLYRHGFTEGAGNFQEDNFGNGGFGSDSVNAEAQDGAGVNNANFATPLDGSNPRMQMFLWNTNGDHLVDVTSGPRYIASGATFGPDLYSSTLSDGIVAANDGVGTFSDACEPLTLANSIEMAGQIALIDRGNCNFDIKVKNAQVAGATGVVIANNQGDSLIWMSGDDITDGVTIVIPSVFVTQSDGTELRGLLPQTATLQSNPEGLVMRDGDVDSDIIYHEYGHGLTWRMIGGMTGAMPGAIGEGMGDVLAILINDDDTVGEYSTSEPLGIRSAAYTNYARTYEDFTGGEANVHFNGEIYAATIWRLWQLFQANALPQDTLFDYLIGGMNFTPSGPAFEDMRDGILIAANGTGHECLIWQAFAAFGVGVDAAYDGTTVSATFDVPAQYSGVCDTSNTPPDTNIASAIGLEDPLFPIPVDLTGSDTEDPVASFSPTSLPANGLLYTTSGKTTLAQIGGDYPATGSAVTLYFDPSENYNGITTFQFAAKDSGGLIDQSPATATITVNPVNDPPGSRTIVSQNNLEGDSVSLAASTTDVDDFALTYSATGLPDGLSIGINDGLITGTVAATAAQTNGGVYSVVVTAMDDEILQTIYPAFSWTVTEGGGDPGLPADPTNVDALNAATPNGTAVISWLHVGGDLTGFEIRREKQNKREAWKGQTIVATVAAGDRSYVDASGTGTFRYQVRALNGALTSGWAPGTDNWVEVTVTNDGTGNPGTTNCNKKANRELPECMGG